MSVRLIVRIPTAELQPQLWDELEWALFQPNGERVAAGVGTKAEIDGLLQQNGLHDVDLTLLVPAQTIVSCHASIPARQARFIQQALPYAVEENIAQDVESMHLTASRKAEKGVYQVLGVPKQNMDTWRAFAESIGYRLTALYPDAMALPYEEGMWSACVEGDYVLLRFGRHECLRLAKANFVQYLDLKTARVDTEANPLQLRVFVHKDEDEANRVMLAELAQIPGLRVSQEPMSLSPFELLCESLQRQSDLLNLCHGPYAVKNERRSRLRQWLPVAGVAAAWFIVQVGIDLGTGIYYQRQADQMSAQARAMYLNIFPNETRVANIRRSLEGKIRAAESTGLGTNFLGLLADAGYQLMQQPNRQAISLRSLNYNRQRSELSIELQAGTFDQLDQYKQALASNGYNVEIGSAINEKEGVRSRMNIRGGG